MFPGKKESLSAPAVVAHHEIWPENFENPAYMNMGQVAPFNAMNSTALTKLEASVKIKHCAVKEKSLKQPNIELSDKCLSQPNKPIKKRSVIAMAPDSRKASPKKMHQLASRSSSTKKLLDAYPQFSIQDEVAMIEDRECSKCKLHVGRIVILPCGHAKFCFKCINTMRERAMRRQCPGRCLIEGCLCVVKSWFVLKNVNHQPN